MAVRVFPPDPAAGYSRHQDRMSSWMPTWTLAIDGSWVHETRVNSQFPAGGGPLPPPTEYAPVRGTTQDCRRGTRVAIVVPWAYPEAHWLTTGPVIPPGARD